MATLPLPPHSPLNEGVADGDRDATCFRQRPPVHPRDKAGRESWHGKWYVDGRQVDRGGEGEKQDVVHAGTFALYLAAAMTGLRQGELVALRWVDVDWKRAGRIRVRRNYSSQEFGTPKIQALLTFGADDQACRGLTQVPSRAHRLQRR